MRYPATLTPGKKISVQLINEAPAAPPMPTMVAPPTLPNSLPNLMPPMLNPAMLAGAGMGGAASMMGANPAAMMGGMPGGMNPAMMAAAGMNPAVMAAMASGLALPGAVPGMPAAGAAPAGPSTCYVLMKNLFDPNGEVFGVPYSPIVGSCLNVVWISVMNTFYTKLAGEPQA